MGVRVLHLLPKIHGYGAERQVVELLKRLGCDDVEAALLTIYAPDPEEVAELPFAVLSADRRSRRDYFFLGRLVRKIREFRPQIVHTHTHVGKYWGRLAAVIAGTPLIVHTEHNPCDFRRTRLERTADWFLHRSTSKIITFFPEQGHVLSEFEHIPPQKLAIIPNGLMLPEQVSGDRADARATICVDDARFVVLVVGRMEYQKNQLLALRALAALEPGMRSRIVMCFAGAGEDEDLLREFARALGVADSVLFLGFRRDVPRLFAGTDLLLMTSWFEGMPLALIEAMIAGVPIVTTPWIGACNMLGDGRFGFLTRDFEPSHVASEIVRALNHPGARREVAERAKRHAYEQFGIRRMVQDHMSLYRQLQGTAS